MATYTVDYWSEGQLHMGHEFDSFVDAERNAIDYSTGGLGRVDPGLNIPETPTITRVRKGDKVLSYYIDGNTFIGDDLVIGALHLLAEMINRDVSGLVQAVTNAMEAWAEVIRAHAEAIAKAMEKVQLPAGFVGAVEDVSVSEEYHPDHNEEFPLTGGIVPSLGNWEGVAEEPALLNDDDLLNMAFESPTIEADDETPLDRLLDSFDPPSEEELAHKKKRK